MGESKSLQKLSGRAASTVFLPDVMAHARNQVASSLQSRQRQRRVSKQSMVMHALAAHGSVGKLRRNSFRLGMRNNHTSKSHETFAKHCREILSAVVLGGALGAQYCRRRWRRGVLVPSMGAHLSR